MKNKILIGLITLLVISVCGFTLVCGSAETGGDGQSFSYTGATALVTPTDGGNDFYVSLYNGGEFRIVYDDDIYIGSPLTFDMSCNFPMEETNFNPYHVTFGLIEVDKKADGTYDFTQVNKWWQSGIGVTGFQITMSLMNFENGGDALKMEVYSKGTVFNNFVNSPELSEKLRNNEKLRYELYRDDAEQCYKLNIYSFAADGGLEKLNLGEFNVKVPFSAISEQGDFTGAPNFVIMLDNYAGKSDNWMCELSLENLRNGKIKSMSVSDVKNLKPGVPQKLQLTTEKYDSSADISDITYTYSSSAPEIVSVDADGYLTTTAGGGKAVITVESSEGDRAFATVLVFDETAPKVSGAHIDAEIGSLNTAFVSLPEVIENSSDYTLSATVISPENIVCSPVYEGGVQTGWSFVPTGEGQYTLEITAADAAGNIGAQRLTFTVFKSERNGLYQLYSTDSAFVKSFECGGEGESFGFGGTVGTLNTKIITAQANAYAINKLPLSLTDGQVIEFDLTVEDYGYGDTLEANVSDWARQLGLFLIQADEDKFDNFDIANFGVLQNGIQFYFGRGNDWAKDYANFRWELTAGSGEVGARHVSDMGSTRALPLDYDRFDFSASQSTASDLNTGKTVHVKYYKTADDKNYAFDFGNIPFLVPCGSVTRMGTDFTGNLHLCLFARSMSGEMNFSVKISNLTNGKIKDVIINEGSYIKNVKYGGKVQLTAKSLGYGATPAQEFVWSVSDADIAEVSNYGLVSIKGIGEVTVRAISKEGKYAQITLSVGVASITLNAAEITLKEGEDFKLVAVSNPAGAVFEYSSDDPYVAVALIDGTVQASKAGECVITVSFGDTEAKLRVKVEKAAENTTKHNGCGAAAGTAGAFGLIAVLGAAVLIKKRG